VHRDCLTNLSLEVPPVGGDQLADYVQQLLRDAEVDVGSLTEPFGTPERGEALLVEVLSRPHFANPRVIKRTLNRLMLLNTSEDLCDWLRSPASVWSEGRSEIMRRYLTWLAGTERFRDLRQFLSSATGTEIADLARCRGVQADPKSVGAPERIWALATMPGAVGYLQQLFGPTTITWHTPPSPLREFDLRLRRIGL
jgi:hypothetical protein